MSRLCSRRMRATRLPGLLVPFFSEKVFMRYEIGNLACLRGFATGGRKGKRQQPGAGEGDANQLSGREIALQAAIDRIRNELGNESVMWLGRTATPRNVPVISTGSLTLDVALGIGGLPKGRVIEIYGPEASGKTTLALHVIAEAQKKGGVCVFIDAEHALDSSLAEAIGVQTNNLLVAQPDCGEHALSVTDTFVRSNSVDVIVIDSVAALVPRVELEGEMGDSHMAVLARLMSQALRKLTHSLARSQTILIFINQIRSKVQTFGSFGGASLEVTSGGNALKFYASVRLNIRKTGLVKRGEEAVGATVVVKIAKNKLAPPFKSAEFEIEFGKGIGKEGEIIDLAVSHKLMSKSGNWYSYNGKQIANGREKAKEYLKEHKDIRDQLDTILKETLMAQPERNGFDENESEDLELLEESHEEQKMVGSS